MGMARRMRQALRDQDEAMRSAPAVIEVLHRARGVFLGCDPLDGNSQVMYAAMMLRGAAAENLSLDLACQRAGLRTADDLLNLLRATSLSGALSLMESSFEVATGAGQRSAVDDILLADEAIGFADRSLGLS